MKTPSILTPGTLPAAAVAENTERRPDETLDLRGVKCPMNLVRVKLALEQIEDGATLQRLLPVCRCLQ